MGVEPFEIHTKESYEDQPVLLNIAEWTKSFPEITAGFTTRLGGVSQAPFSTLNCGLHVNDNPSDVVRNRERIAEALEQPFACFTYAEQVHGNEIEIVGLNEQGMGRT